MVITAAAKTRETPSVTVARRIAVPAQVQNDEKTNSSICITSISLLPLWATFAPIEFEKDRPDADG